MDWLSGVIARVPPTEFGPRLAAGVLLAALAAVTARRLQLPVVSSTALGAALRPPVGGLVASAEA